MMMSSYSARPSFALTIILLAAKQIGGLANSNSEQVVPVARGGPYDLFYSAQNAQPLRKQPRLPTNGRMPTATRRARNPASFVGPGRFQSPAPRELVAGLPHGTGEHSTSLTGPNLYALDAESGKLLGQTHVGGRFGVVSPSIVGGNMYLGNSWDWVIAVPLDKMNPQYRP